jgi:ectoine hydroxylase-related dioxygenase (phytanoyl-CoA dioxygenase family)
METDVADEDAIDVNVPAGTVVFFSANLLHGTHDNTGDRSRFSTAWHYVPGDLALDRFPRDSGKDRHAILRP